MSTRIPLQTLKNLRDLGGMRTEGGRKIAPDRLIRSNTLFGASESDLDWLSTHVGLIIDLRSDEECTEKPDPCVPGAETIHLPVLRSLAAGISRDESSDKKAVSILETDPEDLHKMILSSYGAFVSDDFSVSQYRRFVELLSDPGEKAVLWHCTGGKDRAGFASVIIEALLGVSEEDIIADYLQTNIYMEPEIQQICGAIAKSRGCLDDRLEKTLRYGLLAWEDYIEAAFLEAEKRYGGFQNYLWEGLGADDHIVEKLKRNYLEAI